MTSTRISSSTRRAVSSLKPEARASLSNAPTAGGNEAGRAATCPARRPSARQLGGALDIVRRAAGHLPQEELFGNAAAHQDRDLRFDERLRVRIAIRFGQLHRDAERAATRNES